MQCHECKQWDYKRGNLGELEHQSSIALAIFASKQMVIHEENQSKFQQLEQRIELLREALKVAEDMIINEGYSSDDPCTLYGKNMQAIRAALKESE